MTAAAEPFDQIPVEATIRFAPEQTRKRRYGPTVPVLTEERIK